MQVKIVMEQEAVRLRVPSKGTGFPGYYWVPFHGTLVKKLKKRKKKTRI